MRPLVAANTFGDVIGCPSQQGPAYQDKPGTALLVGAKTLEGLVESQEPRVSAPFIVSNLVWSSWKTLCLLLSPWHLPRHRITVAWKAFRASSRKR